MVPNVFNEGETVLSLKSKSFYLMINMIMCHGCYGVIVLKHKTMDELMIVSHVTLQIVIFTKHKR